MQFLKIAQVAATRGGQARSKVYTDIAAGLLPKPVKLGARAVGFPKDEIDAVLGAVACGASEDEVKALVQLIHARRADRLKSILALA